MISIVHSFALRGIHAQLITTEIDCSNGFPGWNIVGLANTAVKEAKERIKAGIKNSNLEFPTNFHITINLAPADIPKEGTGFDVPIAVGLLTNTYKLNVDTQKTLFIGECGLDGTIRPIHGVLSATILAKKNGFTNICVPAKNTQEATLIPGINILPCTSITQLFNHLSNKEPISPATHNQPIQECKTPIHITDVKGHASAKRALTIAAAGGHNILMTGPPGSGKTMLAQSLISILPPLSKNESIEVTQIHSAAGHTLESLITQRPFRHPHHTSSAVSLTGGGRIPKPGEISLAHHGILFLDEFPEFPRSVLEILRQPLEDGTITVSRAHGTYTFPAQCMLVAAQNPCPCGFANDPKQPCTCTAIQLAQYSKKISGPLLDRIDIHITVPRVPFTTLTQSNIETNPKPTIIHARTKTNQRTPNLHANAHMNTNDIQKHCPIDQKSKKFLQTAYESLHLSGRSLHKIIKVARTIADIEKDEHIKLDHIAEALQLRSQ